MAGSSDEFEFVQNCLRLHFGSSAARLALKNATNHSPHWHGILTMAGRQASSLSSVNHFEARTTLRSPGLSNHELVPDFRAAPRTACSTPASLPIESEFRRSGLRSLALKGPALAVRLYGKLSLRQCRDLDLLVARSDVTKAIDILFPWAFVWSCLVLAQSSLKQINIWC